MTDTDTHADWVDAARRKWVDYQRVLAEAPDNHIAAGIRERSLVEMVPHLIAAYDAARPDSYDRGYLAGFRQVHVDVESWLKARRDGYDGPRGSVQWRALDAALDDLREHMHTGTPLGQPVQRTEEDAR